MKLTLKVALVISLFCGSAFAGDQTNGGYCGDQTNGGCLYSTSTDIVVVNEPKNPEPEEENILTLVRDFLEEIFG